MTNTLTSLDVRERLITALQLDLVGPPAGHPLEREQLPADIRPSMWYLTGFLIPSGTPAERASDPDEDDDFAVAAATSGVEPEANDDRPAARKGNLPSSIGLTFLVDADTRELAVTFRWGDYRLVTTPEAEGKQVWQREPRAETVTVKLTGGRTPARDVPNSGGLQYQVVERPIALPGPEQPLTAGMRSVTIYLINNRPPNYEPFDEMYAFQAEIEVRSARPFEPRPNLSGLRAAEWDELVADLHYANVPEYAVGHAVAADWDLVDGACTVVRTAWLPQAAVEKTVTAPVPDVELGMDALGALADGAAAEQALRPLVTAYHAWLDEQEQRSASLAGKRGETARVLVRQARKAAERIASGIDLLAQSPLALDAFRVANRAVARALRQRNNIASPRWRPFQLAFILLNLPGIADPAHPDRNVVDLLFFPTGGGKTEAYLGLAAFTLVLRRLRYRGDDGLAGAGVSVIMRYTLRLLTLDQLSRATGIICALELERRQASEQYGQWPFEIGLWVGKGATPNYLGKKGDKRDDTARSLLNRYKSDPRGNPPPIPLESCPWCGTRFTPQSFTLWPNADNPSALRVVCPNFACDFSGDNALPIVAIDEMIYRRLPAFLVATVDKFAALPWVGPSGVLLGGANRYDHDGFSGPAELGRGKRLSQPLAPPDLIIQDELHLISGPLGTLAGLYETAIDALCTREVNGKPVGPKIIASTATVRRAQDQIQALFGRPLTDIFPPPGPDRRDSFFARTVPANIAPARQYIGVAAQGRSPKVMMRKAWLALMGAAQQAYLDAGGDRNPLNPADPYMTVLGYFNNLRELGGTRRILEEEVQSTIKGYGERKRVGETRGLFANRERFSEVLELTSRVSTAQVAEARRKLSLSFAQPDGRIDCALATNMISVGLDIPRLGLMVVIGQPMLTAEYIQATSRVGRDENRPGLVVTLLNIHRPRDRSHYERFRHYHETFYRAVEAGSVTPFAARALDRGFAGALLALARHLEPALTPPSGVAQIKQIRQRLEQRLIEIFHARLRQQDLDHDDLDERLLSVQQRIGDLLDAWERIVEGYTSQGVAVQYQPFEDSRTAKPLLRYPLAKDFDFAEQCKFQVGRSLRDVEPEVHLYLRDLNEQPVAE